MFLQYYSILILSPLFQILVGTNMVKDDFVHFKNINLGQPAKNIKQLLEVNCS